MTELVGIWDTKIAGNRLGWILLFQEELRLIYSVEKFSALSLIFANSQASQFAYLSALAQVNPDVTSLFISSDGTTVEDIVSSRRTNCETLFVWPRKKYYQTCSYVGSTLHIQELRSRNGVLINLTAPRAVLSKASRWIYDRIGDSIPIAVHLKNNKSDTESNANSDSWLRFFNYCAERGLKITFIMIGNDDFDERFVKCKNVLITRSFFQSLELDLAIIELSFLFMGMSSGPCNMALLSDRPYLIWKHPDHHREEMEKELRGSSQFSFANEKQRFIRAYDTEESLIAEFNNLYHRIDVDQWRANFRDKMVNNGI